MSKKIVVVINEMKAAVDEWIRDLENAGLEVVYCQGARQVMQHFANAGFQPDVVLTDTCFHPGTEFPSHETFGRLETGIPFCRKLRQIRPELPIVAYSIRETSLRKLRELNDPLLHIFEMGESTEDEIVMRVIQLAS